jgi:hypothetical protein
MSQKMPKPAKAARVVEPASDPKGITKLIVGGFRSFGDRTEIPIAPITLVFGPNSSGKSALLHAMNELKRRIRPDQEQARSSFAQALLVLAGDGAGVAHKMPRESVFDEEQVTPVLLGFEMDAFQNSGSRYGDSVTFDFADQALLPFWALEGEHVGYEILEHAPGVSLFLELRRGDLTVVSGMTFDVANSPATEESCPKIEWAQPIADTKRPWSAYEEPGIWKINVASPLWTEGRGRVALEGCIELSKSDDPQLKQLVRIEGDDLVIRADICQRRAVRWSDSPWWMTTGNLGPEAVHAAPLVDEFLDYMNFLLQQVEFAGHENLDIVQVRGDRQVLTDEATKGKCSVPLNIGDVAPGPGVSDYSLWLGLKTAEPDSLTKEQLKAIHAGRDFVNEALASSLFGSRHYRVCAEVTEIGTRVLARRDGMDDDHPAISLQTQLYLEDDEKRCLDFNEVGSGISYVLPVLTALSQAGRSWIEQPELHLHPRAQCDLGDAVIRAYNRGRFCVVETHSEHMILRLLRRIRATCSGADIDEELRCSPEAVCVLYLSLDGIGRTEVKRLRVSRSGDFMDLWPDGFFEERSRELFDE